MKPPLQALLIAEYFRTAVVNGTKQITIREGHRDYRSGPVLISCVDYRFVVNADIVDVRHCTLQDITEQEWEADGFNSQDNLLEGMRVYYPNLTLQSPVTVVRWANVRGDLYTYRRDLEWAEERNITSY